jgi:hypothetical protein
MDRQGQDIHQLLNGNFSTHFFFFTGWMDNHTMVLEQYSGGGNRFVGFYDPFTDKEIIKPVMFQGGVLANNPDNVLVSNSYGFYELYALTSRTLPGAMVTSMWGVENEHLLAFPTTKVVPLTEITTPAEPVGRILDIDSNEAITFTNYTYCDWYPGTDQVLVRAFHYNFQQEQLGSSALLKWDIASNQVEMVVYGGIDGYYSPNGNFLAFATFSPAQSEGILIYTEPVSQTALIGKMFLQILDLRTGKINFLTPVRYDTEDYWYNFAPVHKTKTAFSPDSRYLAFFSPARLVGTWGGKYTLQQGADPSIPYLNIVDLGLGKIVYSVPQDPYNGIGLNSSSPAWSPDSRYLAYMDASNDWQILDLPSLQTTALTSGGGLHIDMASWSFDGQYLSLYSYPTYEGAGMRGMLIFQVNKP